jgi:REP element-mobilizing transposase RayT
MCAEANSGVARARAYFITFATYGARLHGDANGSVDAEHRIYGTPLCRPSSVREQFKRQRMVQPGYILEAAQREVVLASCREVCQFRGWFLFSAHVRSNHVHVVVQACDEPERVMNDLKSYASRALVDAKLEGRGRRRWARHGSTRYLWDEEQLRRAIKYVLQDQGEPMSVYVAPALWRDPEP